MPSTSTPTTPLSDPLTEVDELLLDFEARAWPQAGAKDTAIADQFELSPTRYYQRINALIEHPGAWAWNPLLMRRLQAARSKRRGRP